MRDQDLVQAQGYSQLQSGMTFLPFTVLMIGVARWAGALADKHGARLFLVAGPAIAGLGLLLLSFVGQTKGAREYWTSFLPGILVLGLGMAFTVAPLTTTVMRSVSDDFSGVASGINNAMTRIANVFANAIFGALAVLLFTAALRGRVDKMGLAPEVKESADLTLSLGPMTWPHLLVRGLLAEQLYRAQQILAGHPYHRS